MKFIFLVIISAVLCFTGCKKDSNPSAPEAFSTGSADFSVFVTLGNSITSGYQSGALFRTAQENSYGHLLANQVKTNFDQPYVSDPGVGGRMELQGFSQNGDPVITRNANIGTFENLNLTRPYNNLGVPGAYVYDIINATNSTNCYSAVNGITINPLFDFILRNSQLKIGSQFSQAKELKATFVTLWIGNNDILGYATAGGKGVKYTTISNFEGMYRVLLDSLLTLKAGIIVANIPDVTAIPFFTTIGPALLKKGYPEFIWAEGSDGKVKQMSLAANYITLNASEKLINPSNGLPSGIGLNESQPFPNNVVLDSAEVSIVKNTIAGYNGAISSLASARGIAVADMNTLFNEIKKSEATGGTEIDGVVFKTDYISGGLFSLDGVHPSSRGQALIANEFIRVINSKFGAKIPQVFIPGISASFQKAVQIEYHGVPVSRQGTFSNMLF